MAAARPAATLRRAGQRADAGGRRGAFRLVVVSVGRSGGGEMIKQDGFGHETPFEGETNDWITPKWIIEAFDTRTDEGMFFDLDPCISITQPWLTARKGYSKEQDGLLHTWWGMVYCNPPYGNNVGTWARRMAEHGEGIMLIFARLETKTWQDIIFPTADGFLFPNRRITFCRPDGTTPKGSAGAPSAFVAWGNKARGALIELCDEGLIQGAFLDRAFYTGSSTTGIIQDKLFEVVA